MRPTTTVKAAMLLLLASYPALAFQAEPKERTWTSVSGKHKTVATLVYYTDDRVALRKQDGTTVSVPFEKLSAKDVQALREDGDNVYRYGALFQVRNPFDGVGWQFKKSFRTAIAGDQVEGQLIDTGMQFNGPRDSMMNLTRQPYHASMSPADRETAVQGGLRHVVPMFQNILAGIKVKYSEERAPDGSLVQLAAGSGEMQGRGQYHLRCCMVGREDAAYSLTLLTPDATMADTAVDVISTVVEVAE